MVTDARLLKRRLLDGGDHIFDHDRFCYDGSLGRNE